MGTALFGATSKHLLRAACAAAAIVSAASLCGPGAVTAAAQTPGGSNGGGVVSVAAYGADPTGSRDSTQAFAQAVASGNSVYVPPGNYIISDYDKIVLNRPMQALIGAGARASILDYTGPCDADVIATDSVVRLAQPEEVVRDLGITSHRAQKCIVIGIQMISNHGLVDNVAVSQMWHRGIAVHGNYNSVLNSDIEYNRVGIFLGGSHQLARGNYISNHWSESPAPRLWTNQSAYWDGIMAEGLTDSVIDGNTVEDNGQSGIYTGGNHSVSNGNIISYNVVRHNRNEGIDQGVLGVPNPSSNYVGHLIIVGNTTEDNFRRDIWLNQVDGAVVVNNHAAYTGDATRWWAHDIRTPDDESLPCAVWETTAASKSDNVIFENNVCDQEDPQFPALVFNPGRGRNNVLGDNLVHGERRVSPNVDRSTNVIFPPRSQSETPQ